VDPSQLQMFGLPAESTGPVGPAEPRPEDARLAAALPAGLRLGTSSWSFPGWEGLVYDRRASEQVLARRGLGAYAQHPLLGAVGVDRTYYAPVEREVFAGYAEAVPGRFRFLVKALQEVTTPWFREARSDRRAGTNERFLDPAFAAEVVLAPLAALAAREVVLLLQFPPLNVPGIGGPGGFLRRLDRFLAGLPAAGPKLQLALELRNAALLTPDYAALLHERGVVHCLNAHPSMPTLREQAQRLGPAHADAPQTVIRWMLARSFDYQTARERFAPFDRVALVDEVARGEIVELALGADGRPTTVIVNNKAEGCSPLSVRALAERIAAELA
jgi:uncharacterized protein YecE (DUF72 family)